MGGGGVNNVPLDIHLHDDLFLLIASTGSRHTDALRLIDDVGLGWGGVNNVPLDIHLHDDLFLLIASTVPRHTEARHASFVHFFIHSFSHIPSVPHSSTHSFIHSFIFSAVQAACTAEEATCTSNRDQFSACTIEGNSACTAEAPPPFGHPKDPHTFSKRDLEPPGACITVNIQSPSQKILCGPIGIPKAYHRHTIGIP